VETNCFRRKQKSCKLLFPVVSIAVSIDFVEFLFPFRINGIQASVSTLFPDTQVCFAALFRVMSGSPQGQPDLALDHDEEVFAPVVLRLHMLQRGTSLLRDCLGRQRASFQEGLHAAPERNLAG